MKLARHRQLQSSSASSQTKEDVAVGQGPVEAGEEVEAAAGEVAKEHLVAVEACSEAPSTRRCFSTSWARPTAVNFSRKKKKKNKKNHSFTDHVTKSMDYGHENGSFRASFG